MIRFTILCTCLAALIVGCCQLTREEAEAAKHTAGGIGSLFGVPAPVGEAVAGAVIAALGMTVGHKHGRRCERKKPTAPKV